MSSGGERSNASPLAGRSRFASDSSQNPTIEVDRNANSSVSFRDEEGLHRAPKADNRTSIVTEYMDSIAGQQQQQQSQDDNGQLLSASTTFSAVGMESTTSVSTFAESYQPVAAPDSDVNEAKRDAQRRSRILNVTLLVVASIIAVAAGILTGVIVYLYSRGTLEESAASRANTVLYGAAIGVRANQQRVVTTVIQQGNWVQSFDLSSVTDNVTMAALLNTSITRAFTSRIHVPGELYGFAIRMFLPRIPDSDFPPQDKAAQQGCFDICKRPGDPNYTSVASWANWYDIYPDGSREYVHAEPFQDGLRATAYLMEVQNATNGNTPLLERGHELYKYNTFGFGGGDNGTFQEGLWLPTRLWGTGADSAYYYFTYQRMFRHQGYSFNSVAFATAQEWFGIMSNLISSKDDEFLILTDGNSDFVLAYSGNELGDPRLENCSATFEDATVEDAVSCPDYNAFDHPSPFIRELFATKYGFVRGAGPSAESQWVELQGERYLLAVMEVFNEDSFRVLGTYAISEEASLRNLKSRVTPMVAICAAIVVATSTLLATVGFVLLQRSHRTVELVAELAFHISRYDIDRGEKALSEHKGASPELELEFRTILDNLRAYRAFLPTTLMQIDDMNQSESSANGSQSNMMNPLSVGDSPAATNLRAESPAPLFELPESPKESSAVFSARRLHGSRLRNTRGTVLLVDVNNLATNNAGVATRYANELITIIIEEATRFSGIVDQIHPTSVVVSFNYHISVVKHEDHACKCALAITSRVSKRLSEVANDKLNVVIAIASGFNLVGTLGTATQKARVIAGETYDLVHKIVLLQRRLACQICVTERVAASTSLLCVPVDMIQPQWEQKNRSKVVTLLELRSTKRTAEVPIATAFHRIKNRHLNEAIAMLQSIPDDMQAARLLNICTSHPDRVSEGYIRNETHWEALEDQQYYASFMESHGSGSAAMDSISERNEVKNAREQLASAAKAKDKKLTMKEEEEGTSLFSMFVADPEPIEETPRCVAESFDVPMTITDINNENWYRSTELIGKGQFGEVYTAISEEGHMCALKSFPLGEKFDVEGLSREVEVLAALRHENIAAYVSCGVIESHFAIMMEYMAAGTLRKLIANTGRLPRRAIYRFTSDILNGLDYLHTNGIVHCDMKPDNMLFAGDGTAKLADFGTAKLLHSSSNDGSGVRGTPRYMAPEAALGEWDFPADVYSVGIIILEMWTGKNPWYREQGDDSNFLMKLSRHEDMMPAMPDDLPPELFDIVVECLQRVPRSRPTITELLRMLPDQ